MNILKTTPIPSQLDPNRKALWEDISQIPPNYPSSEAVASIPNAHHAQQIFSTPLTAG